MNLFPSYLLTPCLILSLINAAYPQTLLYAVSYFIWHLPGRIPGYFVNVAFLSKARPKNKPITYLPPEKKSWQKVDMDDKVMISEE